MPERKKVRHQMRGVKKQLSVGLVSNPLSAVADFTREATTMEHALQHGFLEYHRQNDPATMNCHALFSDNCGAVNRREIIRSIVWEELQKLHAASHQPTLVTVSGVVRDEISQVMQTLASPPITPSSDYEAAQKVMAYTNVPHQAAPAVPQLQPQSTPRF